ncbi:hypothetical protein BC827DRAFT_424825 [Russula dissimulans]|nr:hypothetical protein BC827DRAFT_424825 [Russula dissimulans]
MATFPGAGWGEQPSNYTYPYPTTTWPTPVTDQWDWGPPPVDPQNYSGGGMPPAMAVYPTAGSVPLAAPVPIPAYPPPSPGGPFDARNYIPRTPHSHRSTQETTSPLIRHRCNLHTNPAQARAHSTTPCNYTGAASPRQLSRPHRTCCHRRSQEAVAADLIPTPRLRAFRVLLQRRSVELGYMTDPGHGGPVFKCHDRA